MNLQFSAGEKIGFIFQNYNLIPNLSIYDNIVLPVELDGRKADDKYITSIVKTLGLEDKLYRKPNKLSGGTTAKGSNSKSISNKTCYYTG